MGPCSTPVEVSIKIHSSLLTTKKLGFRFRVVYLPRGAAATTV